MSVYIIAEAGVNHNGCVSTAKKMIDKAKEIGADCIKFQTFDADKVASKYAQRAEYQKLATDSSSQLEMLRKLQLTRGEFAELFDYCAIKGIDFLSTAFDVDSVAFLDEMGIDKWKIPSGEVTNFPYLVKIAETNKPVIMSTGMCTLPEVEEAVKVLKEYGCDDITLLHCTTEYPTPYEDVNLRAIATLRERFCTSVGYSDHTMGIEIPLAAVALGSTVVEKHFTLDRNMEGPDHKASIEPDRFAEMVKAIRNVELAMGDGVKKPAESEVKNIAVSRKSIVASRFIRKGEIFTEDNITTKRPSNGISPMKWLDVLGKRAVRDFMEDELVELELKSHLSEEKR